MYRMSPFGEVGELWLCGVQLSSLNQVGWGFFWKKRKKGSSESRVHLVYLCERNSHSFWRAREEEVHGDRFRSCRYGSKLNWVKEGACYRVAVI